MFNVTRLLDVEPGELDRVLAGLRALAEHSGALRWVIEPTEPGSRNGGDIVVHLRFTEEQVWRRVESRLAAALEDAAITRVNGATYRGGPTRTGRTGAVYRTLLLKVQPETPPQTVARFEAELKSMADYVSTICAWQLSTVSEATGTTAWTHVFEQEFTDVAGLVGPYLMHPIHWAVVDRWFDPETTDVIVRERVCHSFCTTDRGVLQP
ncbi:stress responsive protein [Mycolicibacter engbaekii]|uniref:Stress responsive protein n=1 Tax=Mycolicibacter engbaekii TaxID=188915 RepID=A0A1X1TXV8_9MYCO|nr:Dabb family protein [Mycolicibacter engbaekii]ORV49403.1 stress responsive protein [Mycolicibacter engbaekii]